MRYIFILIVFLYSFGINAQIKFEKGYIVDNNGNKINCLIKNVDWRNNPDEIKYKTGNNSEVKIATVKDISEFGVDNYSKYKRFTVNLDRSSDNPKYLSDVKHPEFKKETLFLKTIIEGDASLYEYIDGNLRRYFIKMKDKPIEPLIYKLYKTKNNDIGYNKAYSQQLLNNLKCNSITSKDIKKVKYNKKSLSDIFIKYNICKNSKYVNYEKQVKRDLFNFYIRPGLNFTSLTIDNNSAHSLYAKFDSKMTIRFGAEAEFILPFNKNKWSIIVEPTYQYFKSSGINRRKHDIEINYQSIELPVGLRYYVFLNDDSKVFVNGAFLVDFAMNSSIDDDRDNIHIDISNSLVRSTARKNIALGVGYNYKNTFSFEIRYFTTRNILGNYVYWNGDYNTISLIVGYNPGF